MARLLVSVRSAEEARDAVSGGADIIDVKEPYAGSLGCAGPSVWRMIRRVVPEAIPLSVALGELTDWSKGSSRIPPAADWNGLAFAKMGLAGSGPDWRSHWMRIRSRFERELSAECRWVAVIYADCCKAAAPNPAEILAAALEQPRCAGVLVDSWSKHRRPRIDLHEWHERLECVQRSGRFLAWAGGLDITEIERLAESGFSPDIIAVRGSACRDGNRLGPIEAGRVSRLREAASRI